LQREESQLILSAVRDEVDEFGEGADCLDIGFDRDTDLRINCGIPCNAAGLVEVLIFFLSNFLEIYLCHHGDEARRLESPPGPSFYYRVLFSSKSFASISLTAEPAYAFVPLGPPQVLHQLSQNFHHPCSPGRLSPTTKIYH
jgi:hypothetical protein